MNKHRPTKKKIVEWWINNTDESEMNFGVDWDVMRERCWRCGYIKKLERCHIIPKSLGGSNSPNNFVLLCNMCHQEAPNVDCENAMIKFIQETNVIAYDVFWIYRKCFDKSVEKASTHWGQEGFNESTKAWIFNDFMNSLDHIQQFYLKHSPVRDRFVSSLKYAIPWDFD